jgi:hypothetical protein
VWYRQLIPRGEGSLTNIALPPTKVLNAYLFDITQDIQAFMAPCFRNKVLLFCFVAAAQAYTIFETSCSTPTTEVNFVSSPDSRGTLDILWSSLFTIVACTWTVQHLNIPEQRNGRDPGWVGGLRWKLKRFLTSAKWMLITMIAPEVVIGMACYDLFFGEESSSGITEVRIGGQCPLDFIS